MEIIENVLDELRRERKVRMVLADDDIEDYIKLDLEGLTLETEDLDPQIAKILESKKKFKDEMNQTVSVMRLGYMYTVLKACHPGRATMLGAEAFKLKVLRLEKDDRKDAADGVSKNLKRGLDS